MTNVFQQRGHFYRFKKFPLLSWKQLEYDCATSFLNGLWFALVFIYLFKEWGTTGTMSCRHCLNAYWGPELQTKLVSSSTAGGWVRQKQPQQCCLANTIKEAKQNIHNDPLETLPAAELQLWCVKTHCFLCRKRWMIQGLRIMSCTQLVRRYRPQVCTVN